MSQPCGQDRPRPLPKIKEMKDATDITERKGDPSWDYGEEKGCWLWKKPPPESKKPVAVVNPIDGTKIKVVWKAKKSVLENQRQAIERVWLQYLSQCFVFPSYYSLRSQLLQSCLEGAFSGQSYIRNRASQSGRTLRAQKNIMKCPSCSNDIAEFLQNPQVNREMMGVIESLQRQAEEMEENSEESSSKNDENLKKLDDETEVSKPCDSSEKVLEELNDNDLNRPHKRRKGAGGGTVVVNVEEHVDEA